MPVGKRLARHERPEIGTADADVDDGIDRLAGVTAPLSGVDAGNDLLHAREVVVNAGDDVDAVERQAAVGR